jgi:hypothetical protein
MTNGSDRLTGPHKGGNKSHRIRVHPQVVRIHYPAREHQSVIIVRVCLMHLSINGDFVPQFVYFQPFTLSAFGDSTSVFAPASSSACLGLNNSSCSTGDKAMADLKMFAEEQHLAASHFTAIGAFKNVILGYFDWEKKDYIKIPLHEQVEVLSLVGDISISEG